MRLRNSKIAKQQASHTTEHKNQIPSDVKLIRFWNRTENVVHSRSRSTIFFDNVYVIFLHCDRAQRGQLLCAKVISWIFCLHAHEPTQTHRIQCRSNNRCAKKLLAHALVFFSLCVERRGLIHWNVLEFHCVRYIVGSVVWLSLFGCFECWLSPDRNIRYNMERRNVGYCLWRGADDDDDDASTHTHTDEHECCGSNQIL